LINSPICAAADRLNFNVRREFQDVLEQPLDPAGWGS
jgi:hypothetical protein